jgi:DNA-binding ferritin-like protein
MSYIEKMKSKKESIPALAVELMDAATKFHVLHLTVTGAGSYAAHKALNNLYDAKYKLKFLS